MRFRSNHESYSCAIETIRGFTTRTRTSANTVTLLTVLGRMTGTSAQRSAAEYSGIQQLFRSSIRERYEARSSSAERRSVMLDSSS
mmetsp:Transcript_14856/g.60408  ORF Transcript_14856/g.60408 Transcript_14856/m.60408 type:complete len:86 (+) Transcript_14856:4090-4347(+)